MVQYMVQYYMVQYIIWCTTASQFPGTLRSVHLPSTHDCIVLDVVCCTGTEIENSHVQCTLL